MILEVRGTVQLQSATGVNKAAVPQALVNLDDRLTLSADAQVQLVFLSDFHKERLKPGRDVTIDWTERQSARAKIRVLVRRILRKYGYPPDKQERATQTVLEQAELLARDWAA